MLSRYRMLGLLCLDNQKRPICLGFAEHAPRHSESFPGQPCACGERSDHIADVIRVRGTLRILSCFRICWSSPSLREERGEGEEPPQNFTFANALAPMPGIKTSSLLYDTELRMFSFSRLLPTTPTIISRAPNQLASSLVL